MTARHGLLTKYERRAAAIQHKNAEKHMATPDDEDMVHQPYTTPLFSFRHLQSVGLSPAAEPRMARHHILPKSPTPASRRHFITAWRRPSQCLKPRRRQLGHPYHQTP